MTFSSTYTYLIRTYLFSGTKVISVTTRSLERRFLYTLLSVIFILNQSHATTVRYMQIDTNIFIYIYKYIFI